MKASASEEKLVRLPTRGEAVVLNTTAILFQGDGFREESPKRTHTASGASPHSYLMSKNPYETYWRTDLSSKQTPIRKTE